MGEQRERRSCSRCGLMQTSIEEPERGTGGEKERKPAAGIIAGALCAAAVIAVIVVMRVIY